MLRKRTRKAGRLLTQVELELMNIIWSRGRTTVKDVADALPRNRRLAYTSVGTMMKILEQKGFLRCEKDAHAHSFSPLVEKTAYETSCLEHVVESVFDGEPVALVQRLLTATRLSDAEVRAIETALRELVPTEKRG